MRKWTLILCMYVCMYVIKLSISMYVAYVWGNERWYYACMYVCVYSLNSHECTSVGRTQEMCLAATKNCKLRSPHLDVRQASTCKSPRVAATGTRCNWNALEVLQCGLMETFEDDRAELENYSLWNWQPVKIISKCRCYMLKLPLAHEWLQQLSIWVAQLSAKATRGSLWQWCLSACTS